LEGFHPDCLPPDLQKFQGDGETGLTMKAEKLGLVAVYNPKIMLYHLVSEERMTLEYFKKRAFYQGICNSFYDIRRKHFEADSNKIKPPMTNQAYRFLRLVKRKMLGNKTIVEPTEILEMRNILSIVEKNAYQKHQTLFKNDTSVKNWVLKTNFLEFNLPKND
jgi:hypothetical protein